MKKRVWSRVLAVALALAMCISMLPMAVFAEDTYGTTPDHKNILVFGASTSSGYGLSDYVNNKCGFAPENNNLKVGATEDEWVEGWSVAQANASGKARISNTSYPWQLKEYIAKTEFGGDLSKVNLNSLALNGMRTNELRAFLDEDYFRKADQIEKEKTWWYIDGAVRYCGFLGEHIDSFVADLGRAGATYKGEKVYGDGNDDGVSLAGGRWGIYIREDGYIPKSYYRAQGYIKEEIKNADVIIVDCAMNNFGTYLAERVAGYAKTPGYESKFGYYKQTIDDLDGVSDRTWSALKVLKKELLEDSGLIESETAQQFADAFIYCYADCVTNFSACVEKIREINPNAKIIAQGVYNTLDGINLVVDGQTIDFGALSAKGFDMVNAYIKGLDKNSPNYYYSDVSGGIETFMNQMVMAPDLETLVADPNGASLMDNMYESFKESFMGDMINDQAKSFYVDNIQNKEAAPGVTLKDLGAKDWNSLEGDERISFTNPQDGNTYYITTSEENPYVTEEYLPYFTCVTKNYIKTQVEAIIDTQYGQRIRQLLFDASHYTTIDLDRIMQSMGNMESVTGEIATFIATGEQPSAPTMELLHIIDRFMLYMGIGQHPSYNGCVSMSEDIIAAYDKLNNGGYTAFEEVFSKYYPYVIGLGLKIKEAYDNGDFDKIMNMISKLDDIQGMLDVIDEQGLTAEQLEELFQMKDEVQARFDEILDALGMTMDDVMAMLDENSSPEKIKEYVEKYEQIKEILDVLDESGLTADQLKQAIQLKNDLEAGLNEALDALGITMDDLIAQGQFVANAVDMEKVVEIIKIINDIVMDLPGAQAELEAKITEFVNEVMAALESATEDIMEKAQAIADAVDIQKVNEIIQKVTEIIENLPAAEEIKAQIEEQIAAIQDMIKEKAGEYISDDVMKQLEELAEMLKKAVDENDYSEIVDKLMPIGQELLAIADAVRNLPEYEKAMNEYIELSNAAMAGLEDRVTTLEKQMAKVIAKSIDVDMKAAVTFPNKKVQTEVSWKLDEDAAGYVFTVDGKEAAASETENGLAYTHTGQKVGQKYTYEVTPFIVAEVDGENKTVYGKTFTKVVTPKVKVAKAKIKSVKAAKKAFTAKWKKVTGADGYQISYKTGKKTKKALVKGAKKVSKKVKKLKSKKQYTVKVRAYKLVNGKKYWGKWSAGKKVKVR